MVSSLRAKSGRSEPPACPLQIRPPNRLQVKSISQPINAAKFSCVQTRLIFAVRPYKDLTTRDVDFDAAAPGSIIDTADGFAVGQLPTGILGWNLW